MSGPKCNEKTEVVHLMEKRVGYDRNLIFYLVRSETTAVTEATLTRIIITTAPIATTAGSSNITGRRGLVMVDLRVGGLLWVRYRCMALRELLTVGRWVGAGKTWKKTAQKLKHNLSASKVV